MQKFIAGILLGVVVTALLFTKVENRLKNSKSSVPVTENKTPNDYPFLAKRIFIDNPNDIIINFVLLRNNIKDYTADIKDKIGIYFEYLPTGVHIGINDRESFYRASLVKIPLVMRAYKMIEKGEIKMDENLVIRRDLLDSTYGELWKTGAGTTLTTREIIDLILQESDNTAYNVLLDRVNQVLKEPQRNNERGIDEVYDYLDVNPSDPTGKFEFTPRSYASILKSLYFSSYLTYQNSEEILDIMTGSKFRDWLPGGVPSDIKIAHKFGINTNLNDGKSVHSDCGIVYQPSRQYILCIMTNSQDFQKSTKYMVDISKMVYDYVSRINQ
jgi:beta-lactamase class A